MSPTMQASFHSEPKPTEAGDSAWHSRSASLMTSTDGRRPSWTRFWRRTRRLRDRDAIYGDVFARRVNGMGIREVLIAPRAPWQNPFAERVIGSIRRECLDHVIVFNERHLRRLLGRYLAYYNATRPHQALHSDSPHSREVQPSVSGRIVATPQVGRLHHRYQRVA